MTPTAAGPDKSTHLIFLGMFLFVCVLFWWLAGILLRLVALEDPVGSWALWVSLLGVGTFAGGYFLPPIRLNERFSSEVIDVCERFAYKATVWLAVPALAL